MTFPQNVSGCANVAGRNNAGTSVPNPATPRPTRRAANANASRSPHPRQRRRQRGRRLPPDRRLPATALTALGAMRRRSRTASRRATRSGSRTATVATTPASSSPTTRAPAGSAAAPAPTSSTPRRTRPRSFRSSASHRATSSHRPSGALYASIDHLKRTGRLRAREPRPCRRGRRGMGRPPRLRRPRWRAPLASEPSARTTRHQGRPGSSALEENGTGEARRARARRRRRSRRTPPGSRAPGRSTSSVRVSPAFAVSSRGRRRR